MSRPRSVPTGPTAAASRRRRRVLTYDDLPKDIKLVIHCVKRAELSSTMLPRRASRREREDSSGAKMSRVGRDGAAIEPFELRTQVINDYVAHTNESLRAAVNEYFADKAAAERRHGKIGTWDVSRVTDMSKACV